MPHEDSTPRWASWAAYVVTVWTVSFVVSAALGLTIAELLDA